VTQSQKEWRRPDVILSTAQRAWAFVVDNVQTVVLAGGAALLIVVGVTVWSYFSDKHAGQATLALGKVLSTYERPIVAAPAPDGGPEDPPFPTAIARCDAVLASLDQLDRKHGGSGAAAAGRLVRAGCLLDAGRDDEATKAYRAYLDESRIDDASRFLAHEGLGYALERKGKFKEALAEFSGMATGEKAPNRDRAMWHEARLLEREGKPREASALYRKILDEFPTTPLRDDIAARSGALDDEK